MKATLKAEARRITYLLIAVCLVSVNQSIGQPTVSNKLAPREIAQRTLPSTVTVTASNSSGTVYGSGFFVAEDVAVTSYHVIEGRSEIFVKMHGQKNKYKVLSVPAYDKKNDLALLKLEGAKGRPLRLNEDDSVVIGDSIFVVGNPEGLEGTFSQGIVSSIRKSVAGSRLQITAPISHGSSGGAVMNEQGEVIGIAQGSVESGQALNFAIPVSILRPLMSNKETSTGAFGFNFQVHPLVQQSIDFYRADGKEVMEIGLIRSGEFMSIARRIFREEAVPENVAWIAQIVSEWKPETSLWFKGMVDSIPTNLGLKMNSLIDERNSLEDGTRASARYLKFLANRYHGNWELAIAGYICGKENVDAAIRKAGSTNFWDAHEYLPRETRNAVPNVLATIMIANKPSQFGFGHLRPAPPLRYDRVRVPASTSLNLVAHATDTTVQYIRYLNPHLRTNMTPPEPYIVNVPAGKSDKIVDVFRPVTKVNSTNLANSVQRETWTSLSNRTGISVADLQAANPGMRTPTGKVLVPVQKENLISLSKTETPWLFPSQDAKCIYVREVDTCMYELGATTSLRAGFKSYGNRETVWVLIERSSFDEMNKMLIENGARPVEEEFNLVFAVMKVLGTPSDSKDFALSPRHTELGNKVFRFKSKSGSVGCASRIIDQKLINYFTFAVWICEPSELDDL